MENPLYQSGLIEDDALELGNISASAPPAPDNMIYPRLPTPGFVQSTNFTMATANYKCKKRILAQGIMQIIFGFLLVLFYIMLVLFYIMRLSGRVYDQTFGIWCIWWSGICCGLLSTIAGAFGIATFVSPTKCRRVSHMILSIFTACFMVVCVVASGVWAVMIVVSRNRCDDQRYATGDYYYSCPDIGFPFGLAVSSACIAFLTFITSIVSAAMVCCNNSRCCCRCCCCCLGANEEMAIGVVGNDGNTVYVVMPLGGAAASGTAHFHGTNESGKQKVIVVQQGVA